MWPSRDGRRMGVVCRCCTRSVHVVITPPLVRTSERVTIPTLRVQWKLLPRSLTTQ
jgi:hypothetical protein